MKVLAILACVALFVPGCANNIYLRRQPTSAPLTCYMVAVRCSVDMGQTPQPLTPPRP